MVLNEATELAGAGDSTQTRAHRPVQTLRAAPNLPAPVGLGLSEKARLHRVAVREYVRLRTHANYCPDCVPGASNEDPPVIKRGCQLGMAGKALYERAYRAWVDYSEEENP